MRSEPTWAEAKLWSKLRNRALADLKFRRQVPLGPYIADFLCKEAGLIVEADGPNHDADYDLRRDAWFGVQGYRVLRFKNEEVAADTFRVLSVIKVAAGR